MIINNLKMLIVLKIRSALLSTSLFLYSSMFYLYYDSQLGSDYNLGKDLSKSKENDQLVKCKQSEKNEKNMMKPPILHKVLTDKT